MSNNGTNNALTVVVGALSAPEMRVKISQALLQGVDESRFLRTALTAIENTPSLLDADRASLYTAVIRAAQDGLLPDRREGALVAFEGKDGRKMVQWMPMFFGLRKRLHKCGILLEAQVVYEHDEFSVELGDQPRIVHRPKLTGDRGAMICAYAIATTTDGQKLREIMTADEIEAVHKQSRAADSLMWKAFTAEAWRKTVGRRLCKAIPALDDGVTDMLKRSDEEFSYEPEPPSAPEMPATMPRQVQANKRARALQRVVEAEKVGAPPPPTDKVPAERNEFDDY
jgi:recombination protein RecT